MLELLHLYIYIIELYIYAIIYTGPYLTKKSSFYLIIRYAIIIIAQNKR